MNLRDISCPTCDAKTLKGVTHTLTVECQGKQVNVNDLEGCLCQTCGADPVLTPQIRANQIRIADAKRASIGLLSGIRIKEIREMLGLSQSEAAEIFGGGANAFSKYERGEVIQGASMDKLLRAADELPQVVDFLKCNSDVSTTSSAQGAPSEITLPATNETSWTFTAIPLSVSFALAKQADSKWLSTKSCANDDYMQLQMGMV